MTSMKVARIYLRVTTDRQDLQHQESIVKAAKAAGTTSPDLPEKGISGAG